MNEAPRQAPPLAELILEQAADAVIYANRQGIIERWNQAATALFGYDSVILTTDRQLIEFLETSDSPV